jgi:hypothetical protein
VPQPTVLLLSTSDTDLITARASGADFRWANPSRLLVDDLAGLLDGVDVVVVRVLGGYRAWEDGIRPASPCRRTSIWRRAAPPTWPICTPSCATPC